MTALLLCLCAFSVAAMTTYFLTPAVAVLASRWGVVDEPGGRRTHSQATPRLGGLAVLLGLVASSLLYPHQVQAEMSNTPELMKIKFK